MNETINELIENKKKIDSAFLDMLVKVEFLNEKKSSGRKTSKKEDFEKWFNIAVNEYEQIRCVGCCKQEA
jgi:hypothetical protein